MGGESTTSVSSTQAAPTRNYTIRRIITRPITVNAEGYMSNTLKIIERVRETTGTGTDYAVSKVLGMSQSNLGRVLKGEGFLGDKAQRLAAKILGLSFDDVNALVNEDKAHSEADKAYWRSLCPEAVRAIIDAATKTAAACIVATALISSQGKAHAAVVLSSVANSTSYTLCASWIRRIARWFVRCRASSMRFSLTRSTPIPSGTLALCHGSF